jgi:hypothetical protein
LRRFTGQAAQPVRFSFGRAPRITVPPKLDTARLDPVTFQFAREAHAVAAAVKLMRPLDSTTQHMLAAVACLWRSLFGEIFADQAIRIGDPANVKKLAKVFGGL